MTFCFVLIFIVFARVMGQWYKQINCGLLGEENCGKVKFCLWNNTVLQVEKADLNSGLSIIATVGGRCVNDPCLSYFNNLISGSVNNLSSDCPKDDGTGGNFYEITGSGRHYCSVTATKDPPTGGEYWCAQDNEGILEDCQSDATGKKCVNSTTEVNESTTFKEEICSWYNIEDDKCFLDALRADVYSCNTTNNQCKEYDIEGIKICHKTDVCDAHGADCFHYPYCMVMDGHCVEDKCFSLTYDEFKDECSDSPEFCSGHQFKIVYYNYTYQAETPTDENQVITDYPYYYHEYTIRYTYQWKCTNRNYNSNPNPFYFLNIEEGGPGLQNNSVIYKKNYWWKSNTADKCKVARDPLCGYCADFPSDDTECTGAGGQWLNLTIKPVCSDGRRQGNGARAFGVPSSSLMAVGAVLAYALVMALLG